MISSTVSIGDIMSRNVLFAKPEQPFTEVARLFSEMDIHHLPVTDEEDRLIGIISANDIMQAYSRWLDETTKDDGEVTVADLMTSSPYYVAPANSLRKAAELFAIHSIQCLPVVEGVTVVGIITARDLIKHIAEEG